MYNSCSDPAKTQTPTAYATILDYINTLCTIYIAAAIQQKPQKPQNLPYYT